MTIIGFFRAFWEAFSQTYLGQPEDRSGWHVMSMWDSSCSSASEEPGFPEGTDLSIKLPVGCSYEMIVDYILGVLLTDPSPEYDVVKSYLKKILGLNEDQACRAFDRTMGGVARALSNDPDLVPDEKLDPVAWCSFQRASRDPAVIAAFRKSARIPAENSFPAEA